MNLLRWLVCLSLMLAALPSFAGTKGDVTRGKKVFQDMNCSLCHTDGGNNLNPERPLKGEGFLKRYPVNKDNLLVKTIREGVKDKSMPAYGKDKMSDQNLADVIAYLRSLSSESTKKPAK